MPSEQTRSTEKQAPLAEGTRLARLVGIGVVLLGVAGAFLYLGGWFTPYALTPAGFVDAFERVNAIHSGFRRNHAKGVGVSGFFESNGQGTRLSKAGVFRTGLVPVIGRFSLSGGDPYVADTPDTVRGLGLQFWLPDGEEWRTAMVNLPLFPFSTPQGFYDNLVASQPDPKTGKPDPGKMAAFIASHPETVEAIKIIKSHPVSSGFDNATYNSLNAFRFIDAGGKSIYVRWSMVPVQPFVAANTTAPAPGDKNYLFDALIASVHERPLQWHLVITVGQPGDVTSNPSTPWPDGREQVDVGILTLDSVDRDDTSPARDINFDPLILPVGMAPSDDPVLNARSPVYSQSFTRRAGEAKNAERDHASRGAKVNTKMTVERQQFTVSMRFLHWLMAAMVLTMLGIGVAMVSSLASYHGLLSIHRPLGILILLLVVIRYVNRRFSSLPPFPATMSSRERFAASASEVLLYILLFVQPLVGWGMLSAARYPIVLYGSLHLFPILPHSDMLYAVLRKTHTVLAYLLFLTFIAHFGAVLFHTLIVRDGMFDRMAPWRVRAG